MPIYFNQAKFYMFIIYCVEQFPPFEKMGKLFPWHYQLRAQWLFQEILMVNSLGEKDGMIPTNIIMGTGSSLLIHAFAYSLFVGI